MALPDPENPLLPKSGEAPRTPETKEYVIAIFAPWLLFVFLLTLWGFKFHHSSSTLTWLSGILFLCYCIYLLIGAHWRAKKKPYNSRWSILHAVTLTVATFVGITMGDMTYWTYMFSYYEYEMTSPYVNIDPSRARGQGFMDSGQVYFKEGTFVATEEAIAFQMKDIYCAAPIVRQPVADHDVEDGEKAVKKPYSGTFDFWAVGVNCCMPSGERFRCFDALNPHARSGLRLLRDDLRPFFKLAVEEWSSAYSTPIKHPLFFYWLNDPAAEVDSYAFQANWRFWYYAFVYAFVNIILVVFLRYFLVRMGF